VDQQFASVPPKKLKPISPGAQPDFIADATGLHQKNLLKQQSKIIS
jgi:hypothetical protein